MVTEQNELMMCSERAMSMSRLARLSHQFGSQTPKAPLPNETSSGGLTPGKAR